MATKKAGGSTENGRDSISKRRGVKRFGSQDVLAGEVIVRQKGTLFRPGKNAYLGKDWTIHAGVAGRVSYRPCKVAKFNGRREMTTLVSVVPVAK